MIERTEEEIVQFIKEIYKEDVPDEITVSKEKDHVEITIADMYSSPELSFSTLLKISEFFGTQNINDDDRFSEFGCDTCDYGSSYGFTLTVRD